MRNRTERLLFRYSSALARGDFETIATILRDAERDPALEQMIDEMNAFYSTEADGSSNHHKRKEMPMVSTVYQPTKARTSARLYEISLAAAALMVVAVIGMILGARIQGNGVWNNGQGGAPVGLGAPTLQNNSFCAVMTLTFTEVRSRPMLNGIIVGTLESGVEVDVYDMIVLYGDQGSDTAWYYIAAPSVQGWVMANSLDSAACPQPQPFTPTLAPPLLEAQSIGGAYTVYIVEQFDSMASIMQHFNLDNSWLPELLRLNNLLSASGILPGTTLLLPALPSAPSVTCGAVGGYAINVYLRPTTQSEVLTELPPSTQIEVLGRIVLGGNVWYVVTATLDQATFNGWIQDGGALNITCEPVTASADSVLVQPLVAVTATPTPSASLSAATNTP